MDAATNSPSLPGSGLLSRPQVDAVCAWLRSIDRTDLVHFAGAAWRSVIDATVTRLAVQHLPTIPSLPESWLREAARAIHYAGGPMPQLPPAAP